MYPVTWKQFLTISQFFSAHIYSHWKSLVVHTHFRTACVRVDRDFIIQGSPGNPKTCWEVEYLTVFHQFGRIFLTRNTILYLCTLKYFLHSSQGSSSACGFSQCWRKVARVWHELISLSISMILPKRQGYISKLGSSDIRLCPFELKMDTITTWIPLMDTTTTFLSVEGIKEASNCDMQLQFSGGLLGLEYWLVDLMVGIFWDDWFWLFLS